MAETPRPPYKHKNCSPNQRACNKCGHPIYWATSRSGKNIACDPDGVCHWEAGRCDRERDPIAHDPSIHRDYEGERPNPHADGGRRSSSSPTPPPASTAQLARIESMLKGLCDKLDVPYQGQDYQQDYSSAPGRDGSVPF